MFTSTLLNPRLSLIASPCNVTMPWPGGNPVCSHAFASTLRTLSDYSLREQNLNSHALFSSDLKFISHSVKLLHEFPVQGGLNLQQASKDEIKILYILLLQEVRKQQDAFRAQKSSPWTNLLLLAIMNP